ncbi:uncharacterized protein BX663DRAFT_502120 [Cokeromyces recurvatus]|uniref:uncharacterized protein n=1 Tax=Cokeromyces recurvatus TaxID=90255 RepID=UPI00221F3C87|nr:uncharacterized protein BX663DRAFT_502120 [Cokeromyces recurvatus]KAI7905209.1 hypothetical protein BX663DRAFT_502120 [Cokeromyces recurvatus]
MPPTPSVQNISVISNNVCTTAECLAASSFIKQYVNLDIDPCSDFFQYTCDSWLKSPAIQNKTTAYNKLADIEIQGREKITKILDGTYEDISKNLKTNSDGFNLVEQADIDKSNFQFLKDYYEVCLNLQPIISQSIAPLYADIAHIQNDLFPVNLALIMAHFTREGIPFFFNPVTQIDIFNHEYDIPVINLADLNVDMNLGELLTTYISSTLQYPKNDTTHAQFLLQESQKTNISFWTPEEIDTAVINFRNFEEKLMNATEKMTATTTEETRVTVGDIQNVTTAIDWVTYLDTLVMPGYASPNSAIYADISFTHEVDQVIQSSSPETIQQFFIIRYIIHKITNGYVNFYRPASTTTATTRHNETVNARNSLVNDKIFKRIDKEKRAPDSSTASSNDARKIYCADQISRTFPHLVGRFYTLETFGASQEKLAVENFINNLKEVWLNHLPGTSWFDPQSKARAIEKINMISQTVGYNTILQDWTNPSALKAYYSSANNNVDKTSYYNSKTASTIWKTNQTWKSLTEKNPRNRWLPSNYPQQVNAFYNGILNSVFIPVGILQQGFYDATFPMYLNYGGLGTVIGHELTHSLDSEGRHYNETGYREEWWAPSSVAEFESRSQCFANQYSKEYFIDGETNKKVYIDGNLTLPENIADNGGVSLALLAYKQHIEKLGKQELLLPGLESLTQEQLLLIGYGISRCEHMPSNLAGWDRTDTHAPWKVRVNLSLRNNAEFANIFNCPVGSPMNPKEEKCTLW